MQSKTEMFVVNRKLTYYREDVMKSLISTMFFAVGILSLVLLTSSTSSEFDLKRGRQLCKTRLKLFLGGRFYRKHVKLDRSFSYCDPREFTEKGFKRITEYHYEYKFNFGRVLKCNIHFVVDTLGKFKSNEEEKLWVLKELLSQKMKYDSLISAATNYFGDNRFEIEILNGSKQNIKIDILDQDELVEPFRRERRGIRVDPKTYKVVQEFTQVREINI